MSQTYFASRRKQSTIARYWRVPADLPVSPFLSALGAAAQGF